MRVLRVVTRPNVGGPIRQAVALWHAHRGLGVRTLLVTGVCDPGEAAIPLAQLGLPILDARVTGTSEGVLQLPDLRRGLAPLRDRRARGALARIVAAFGPDVVHSHTSKAGWLARRAARGGRAVVAHTFHGHVLRDYYAAAVAFVLRRVERALAARSDLLFAVSPSCRAELAELGVAPAQRITVLPPAVDTSRFSATTRAKARARLGAGGDQALVAFVGRLVPIKRPLLFAQLVGRLPLAAGHVFGDGPLRASLAQGAPANLVLHGVRDDLADVMAAFDVLVLTSRREGCPLAAIEAFAAGVPVVGFDVPGVRDVLAEWGSGVLVPESAGVPGLAAAVRDLLADRVRRELLVARAGAGLPRFLPAAVAAELQACYRRARAPQGSERRFDAARLDGSHRQ
jgi:glycosyltransferase involved in cell wall biosynthesis